MKPDRFLAAVGVTLALCALPIPVKAQGDPGSPPVPDHSTQGEQIPSSLTPSAPKTAQGAISTNRQLYQPGQPIAIDFTISNMTGKTIHYDYPSSQQFDVTVTDSHGSVIWDWARGRSFPPRISSLSLKPAKKETYRVVWNGLTAQGQVVPPGLYTINARMTSSDRPAITGSFAVNVDTDPENFGTPTRNPSDNGAIREVYPDPPVTASTTVPIGVPAPTTK